MFSEIINKNTQYTHAYDRNVYLYAFFCAHYMYKSGFNALRA